MEPGVHKPLSQEYLRYYCGNGDLEVFFAFRRFLPSPRKRTKTENFLTLIQSCLVVVPPSQKLMHSATISYYAALDWMSYLHHPPPSSWVARTAATFRILALLLILPCIFLTALVSP